MGRQEDYTGNLPIAPNRTADHATNAGLDAKRTRRRRVFVWTALALFAWATWNWDDTHASDRLPVEGTRLATCPDDQFAWDSIIPSEKLEWVRCYQEPFECARLEVPLDYAKPHGQKAAIALIRLPSKYPVGHELWRGPILYNPGGPGGSGVSMVRGRGQNFSQIIGDDYDHVGFDPRGLGFTTPSLRVFTTEAEEQMFTLAAPETLNNSADALAKAWGWSKLLGQLAEERKEANWVAQHMSTALVSRDMLSITRAYGRDKLLYWGFSYGSVLGSTYVTMFPDNVERVIIDGVVDVENYYEAAWSNNLLDTDAGFDLAISSCAKSSQCPLFTPASPSAHTSSASVIRARIDSIVASLNREPLVARDNATGNYGLVGGATARALIFQALYKPMSGGMHKVFAALEAAEKGDGLPLLRASGSTNALWRCNSGPGRECGWMAPAGGRATTVAIACGEGDVVRHDSIEDLKAFYEKMSRLSSFAEMWTLHTFCSGWNVRTVDRFNGPFIANTSFPVLLIGNTADPVTPLWAAKKMSRGFRNSVVLTQNSPGHCSLSATSLCSAKAIRAYFRDGYLPKVGTVCEVEDHIFVPDEKPTPVHDMSAMSSEDQRLLAAMRDASAGFDLPKFGLPSKRL